MLAEKLQKGLEQYQYIHLLSQGKITHPRFAPEVHTRSSNPVNINTKINRIGKEKTYICDLDETMYLNLKLKKKKSGT